MELRLRTLTPLHIGNGDDLHTLDYVVHQNKFYHVPQQHFFRFLATLGKDTANAFADWTVELADKIDDLEEKKRNSPRGGGMDFNQELSKLRQGFTYMAFARKIGKDREFIQFMQANVKGQAIGSPNQLRPQIRSLLKSGDGKAYLPGTSLKGAIRTALLYNILENSIAAPAVEKILKSNLDQFQKDRAFAKHDGKRFNMDRWKKSFAEELEHLAFYCEFTNAKGKVIPADEKFDVLKFLLVADGQLPEQTTRIDNVDIFLVKKLPKGKQVAQSQKQAPGVEAIEENLESLVKIDFNIDAVWGIMQSLKGGVVKSKDGSLAWKGFAEKIKQVFSIDIQLINAANKEQLRKDALSHVMDAVKKFSSKQLQRDEVWLKRFKDHDIAREFSRPVDLGFQQVLKRREGTLLRFGYATGFNGTTEVLYVLDKFKPLFKTIMEEFSIGDSPTAGRNRKPGERYIANPDDFPKSRRWISRPDIIVPPGWVEIMNFAPVTDGSVSQQSIVAAAPVVPKFPSVKVRQNTELDAEIVSSGVPNKITLFLSETDQPIIDLKYGLGFGEEKVGRIIVVAVSGIDGKGKILSVRFVKEK